MSANKSIIQLYNPALLSQQDLIDSFIVRQSEYQRIMDDILRSQMKFPEQDYLIQGLRGMGKTTLLRRIAYQIEKEEKLKDWLIPIVFPEEQYGIFDLASLWAAVAEMLEQKQAEFSGLADKLTKPQEEGKEGVCFEILIQALKNAGKKIILFIDNVGDLFNKLTEKETHRLREILIKTAELRIICADARILEHTYDYGKPFFDFFKVVPLQGLKRDDIFALLTMLAERNGDKEVLEILQNQPQRIDALRQFTGGVIRTIVLLYEILKENKTEEAFSDLQAILDRVTPLYKHRMDDLKPQQQRIVHHIAMAWESVTAGEIAAKVSLPVKAVSAQLAQLEKNGIIEIVKQEHTKNHLYRIAERFFNIWYLMRMGGAGREKIKWLTKFIEIWFEPEEMEKRIKRLIKRLQSENKMKAETTYLLCEAFANIKNISWEVQNELHEQSATYFKTINSDLNKALTIPDFKLFEEAIKLLEEGNIDRSESKLREVVSTNYITNSIRAFILAYQGKTTEGQSLYEKAKKEFSTLNEKQKLGVFFVLIISVGLFALSPSKGVKNAIKFLIKGASLLQDQTGIRLYLITLVKEKDGKKEGLKLLPELEKNGYNAEAAFVVLWDNEINQAIKLWHSSSNESKEEWKEDFLRLLLSKKQYHSAKELFETFPNMENQQNTVLHYTILHFLQKEYPSDYNRMPPELRESVEKMVAKVKQMEIDYA